MQLCFCYSVVFREQQSTMNTFSNFFKKFQNFLFDQTTLLCFYFNFLFKHEYEYEHET